MSPGSTAGRKPATDNFGRLLRDSAIEIIKGVEEGRFLDEAIDRLFSRHRFSDVQKALIHEIASGVIRWKGYLDHVLKGYLRKGIKKEMQYLLWISLYQVEFMKKGAYHVVNETVEYVKAGNGPDTANFVNAILRRRIREIDAGQAAGARDEAVALSFPSWLVRRWRARFGDEKAHRLLAHLNKTPEYTLRVNLGRIAREEAARRLEGLGVRTREGTFIESALYVDRLGPVLAGELFKGGLVAVQDEASQLAGRALDPAAGETVLDACAGSGTKGRQIRESGEKFLLVSMDLDERRLRLSPNQGTRVVADGLASPFPREVFDRILVDAPCSSLGIVRKHPEIKWRREERDIRLFGQTQFSLVKALWTNLKKGGRMVYSVCSFEPEETTEVIEALANEKQLTLENPFPILFNRKYSLSLPHETGMDGFFIAGLKKL